MPKGPILSTSEVCAHTPGEEELFPQPSSLQATAQDSIYRWLCRHSAALAHGMCARVLLTSPRLSGAKLRGEPPPQSSSWHRPPQSLPSTEAGEGTSQGRQWEEGREGRREEGREGRSARLGAGPLRVFQRGAAVPGCGPLEVGAGPVPVRAVRCPGGRRSRR